jgi:hypothetical protein
MRWKGLVVGLVALVGCIYFGGKLDTPIEGGGSLGGSALGGGSLGPATDGGVTGTFACDHHALDSTCTTYASGTAQADAQARCDGTLLQTACPTSSSVGQCQFSRQTDTYYSDGTTPHTATDAKQTCDFNGGVFAR